MSRVSSSFLALVFLLITTAAEAQAARGAKPGSPVGTPGGSEKSEQARSRKGDEKPALHASQQLLAQSLPQFRPYATLEADDVKDCETDVRREFALN